MIGKFAERTVTLGVSILLAICTIFGALLPEHIQAAETGGTDTAYSIGAFYNIDAAFQSIDWETVSTKILPEKDVELLIFGATTCASTWLTISYIAESEWIHDPKISVIYVDINGADAEVIRGTMDQYANMTFINEVSFRSGCEKIIFCQDAEGKNEEVRYRYHVLSQKWGTLAMPMTMLIDKNNVVREMLTNFQKADKILPVINQVIATGNAAEEDKKDDTGKDDTGKDDTGKEDTGKDDTGKDDTGKDDTGKNDTENNNTEKDNTGKNETGNKVIEIKPESVSLSKTSLTYNGKAQRPIVTVKDSKGNQISSANYTITYSNNVNVGQATVTVTFKNSYSGTVRKTFLIQPKGTTLVRLMPKKKGFVVRWKKLKNQISGYELQYSTNKTFKSAKTIKTIKAKTTSKKASKLKAGKKYYVRIRTYKTAKVNGKSTKLYSGWSKAKSVVTKK